MPHHLHIYIHISNNGRDLYTRYPIVARALGLQAECAREQRNLAYKVEMLAVVARLLCLHDTLLSQALGLAAVHVEH